MGSRLRHRRGSAARWVDAVCQLIGEVQKNRAQSLIDHWKPSTPDTSERKWERKDYVRLAVAYVRYGDDWQSVATAVGRGFTPEECQAKLQVEEVEDVGQPAKAKPSSGVTSRFHGVVRVDDDKSGRPMWKVDVKSRHPKAVANRLSIQPVRDELTTAQIADVFCVLLRRPMRNQAMIKEAMEVRDQATWEADMDEMLGDL